MKQPEVRPLCRQISCKATSVSANNLRTRVACVALPRPWNSGNLTRHEFFVKKFERALLQAVESNRLRRFGRLREFSRSCFSLACAARIIFFAKIRRLAAMLCWRVR